MQNLSLGDRQKTFYENITRTYLPRRTFTLFRIDGKAFHTYCRGLAKPFDVALMHDMDAAAIALCEQISGAVWGYVQSDEISILVADFNELTTQAWLDNELRKIVSISASIATMNFNKARWARGITRDALFDSRAWTIPSHTEVINYFIFRQQDCIRNSIASCAQSLYSHNELHKKNTVLMQEMIAAKGEELRTMMVANQSLPVELHDKPDLAWKDLPLGMRNGRFITKEYYDVDPDKVKPNKKNPDQPYPQRARWVSKGASEFHAEFDDFMDLLPKY